MAAAEAPRDAPKSEAPSAIGSAEVLLSRIPSPPPAPRAAAIAPIQIPDALPAYQRGDFIGDLMQVVEILGEGGFGIVYLARSLASNEIVALKTLRGELLRDPHTRALFEKEAKIWIDLGAHPNLVRARWVDEIGGRLYIAMEFVRAGAGRPNSLEGHLEKGPIETDKALGWAIQFCRGMEYAVSKGVRCHRDIKPANILIGGDSVVKISDFGIAGLALAPDAPTAARAAEHAKQANDEGDPARTVVGTVFGTPTHMSPEQFVDAASCDERSDIYSFGVVLYQMASRRLPFYPAPPPPALREQKGAYYWHAFRALHTQATAPPLNSPLAPVIARALKKKREERYQSFSALRADLEALAAQTGAVSLPPLPTATATATDWNAKGISLATLNRWEEALACYDRALALEPDSAPVHNNRGNALRNLDRIQEALAALDKSIALDPLYAAPWENKGLLYARAQHNEEALQCTDRALSLDPTKADPWVTKGVLFGRLQRHDEQQAAYDAALRIDPRNGTAWFNKANLLSTTHKVEALECVDHALACEPGRVDAWDLKGTILSELGRAAEAVPCHLEAVKLDPSDGRFAYNLGNSWSALGRLDEARASYEAATRLAPDVPITWYNRALATYRLGRSSEALTLFLRFLSLDPPADGLRKTAEWLVDEMKAGRTPTLKSIGTGARVAASEEATVDAQALPPIQVEPASAATAPAPVPAPAAPIEEPLPPPRPSMDALNKEATTHFNAGQFVEALGVMDRILRLEPLDEWALNTRANALFKLGRKAEACDSIVRAVEAAPGQLPIWMNKALIENGAGRPKAAHRSALDLIEIAQVGAARGPAVDAARLMLADFQSQGIVPEPRSHAGWIGLGFASMVAGRAAAGLDFFDKAVLAAPANIEALRWKASALKEMRRADDALALYDKALAIAPDSPTIHHDRGVIFAMLREFERAVESFDRALALDPDHVASLSDKGKYAGELRRYDDALKALRRAAALMPDHPAPWLNKALVEDILHRDEDALLSFERFLERAKPDMRLQIESSKRRVEQLRARVAASKGAKVQPMAPRVPAIPSLEPPASPPTGPSAAAAVKAATLVLPEVSIPRTAPTTTQDECLKRSEMARNQALFDRALEWADQAIVADPRKYSAWMAKAEALFGLKRFAEAAAHAKKVTEITPKFAPAWVRLATGYEGLNAFDLALAAWDKTVELATHNVLYWGGRGLCLAKLGRLEDALASLDQALAIDPRFSLGKFYKGRLEHQLGKREDALKSFQQFLSLAPPNLVAQIGEARERIAEFLA